MRKKLQGKSWKKEVGAWSSSFPSAALITRLIAKFRDKLNKIEYEDKWRTLRTPKLHSPSVNLKDSRYKKYSRERQGRISWTYASREIQKHILPQPMPWSKIVEMMRQSSVKSSLFLKAALDRAEKLRVAQGHALTQK